MAARRVIHEIHGEPAYNPIPLGFRVGDLVYSSTIVGADLATGTLPQSLRAQLEMALQNAQTLVEREGGSKDNIARVTVFVDDPSDRAGIEEPWNTLFPDPADRPARKTMR